MALTVRYPKIDYSKVRAHWAPNLAFAHHRNATSFIPTPIEPWLIKIMQLAKGLIPPGHAKLEEDVENFIGQESQHFRQHRMFNKALVAQGYPELEKIEKQLAEELDEFLKNRSLKFLLAYADGFESLGAVSGCIWFEQSDAFLKDADPNMIALWKWHMAEEFEHREVCFQIYHALFGRGVWKAIVNGYFYRIYGFLFAMVHLNRHMSRMARYMMDVDKAKMTAAEKQKVEADEKLFKKFLLKTARPLLYNFLPWYNPGRKRMPKGLMEYLKRFEPGGDYSRMPSDGSLAPAKS